MEFDTQDILGEVRNSQESGEEDSVFFLYVATPGKPPSALHSKIIAPFLKDRGWRKVSYKSTGFRALYFLRKARRENRDSERAEEVFCDGCQDLMSTENARNSKGDRDGGDAELLNDGDEILNISATQEVTNLRSDLKREIEKYKTKKQLQFQVHIVISKPLDYEEDLEFVSQPDSLEF